VAGSFGSTCRWKALRVRKAALVDAGVAGKALAASQDSVSESSAVGQEVSEAKPNNLARGRKRRGEVASPGAVLGLSHWARSWAVSPKLEMRRQARVHLGFCFRKDAARRIVVLNTFQPDGRSVR